MRGLLQAEPKRLCHVAGDGAFAQAALDRQTAARQRVGIDKTKDEVGVGHRRAVVAEAIAGRAWHGARRLRTDREQPPVDASQRTAAGTNLGDVDCRHLQQVATRLDEPARGRNAVAELVFRGHTGSAGLDNDRLGGGAAHVEHDEIGPATGATQPCRADHATCGARCHHEHGRFAGAWRARACRRWR